MSLENGENTPTDGGNEEQPITKRSECKRLREKQRRSDMSNAFDELSAFIVQVGEPAENGDPDANDGAKKKRKKSDRGEDASGITRLELIDRGLRIMRRLHTENEERKRVIATIQEKGGTTPNDNVSVMMVPTLTPIVEEPYPFACASYPPSYVAGYPPHYYHGSHPQAPVLPDYYGQQVRGRGPSPQYHPQWGGYHGRGAPPVMSPHNTPPPYGTPSTQHRMATQEHASYSGPPRPTLE